MPSMRAKDVRQQARNVLSHAKMTFVAGLCRGPCGAYICMYVIVGWSFLKCFRIGQLFEIPGTVATVTDRYTAAWAEMSVFRCVIGCLDQTPKPTEAGSKGPLGTWEGLHLGIQSGNGHWLATLRILSSFCQNLYICIIKNPPPDWQLMQSQIKGLFGYLIIIMQRSDPGSRPSY